MISIFHFAPSKESEGKTIYTQAQAQAQADAIAQPKSVWWDITRIVVRTGSDIPIDPT